MGGSQQQALPERVTRRGPARWPGPLVSHLKENSTAGRSAAVDRPAWDAWNSWWAWIGVLVSVGVAGIVLISLL